MCDSCRMLERRGDSSAGGDEACGAVFGVVVKQLAHKGRLENGHNHAGSSRWTLGVCEKTRLDLL